MEKEQLIAKKVKHQFNGKETLFSVDSLNTHFDGLLIHESDILTDEFEDQDEGYVRVGDVNFDNATEKEVKPVEEIEVNEPEDISSDKQGTTFDIIELSCLNVGGLAKLPEWEGFWFKNLKTGELLVFTKDNEILDTPLDEYKLREDWISVEATPEQKEVLALYFESLDGISEESPKTDFDEEALKNKLDANDIKYQQLESKDSPNGIAIDVDSIPEGKAEEVFSWFENSTSEISDNKGLGSDAKLEEEIIEDTKYTEIVEDKKEDAPAEEKLVEEKPKRRFKK